MDTINLTCPRNFGEMTEKQLRYLAALQISGQEEQDIWEKCFVKFANIKVLSNDGDTYYFKHKKSKQDFTLSTFEVLHFSKKLNWTTKKYAGIKPLAKIRHYSACDHLLRDTKFIQYTDAENFYQAYIFTKNDMFLYKLMGTLYQKGSKYTNGNTEKLAKYFSKNSTEVEKFTTIMWMMGVKQYFLLKFKYLFVKSGAENEDEDDVTPPDMYEILKNQIRMLTSGDVTKEKDVLSASTWSALGELDAQ